MEWQPMPLDMRLNKIRSSRRESVAKKILMYYDGLTPGTEFTAEDILKALGIEYKQIKQARKDNPDLNELFKTIKGEGTNKYRKP